MTFIVFMVGLLDTTLSLRVLMDPKRKLFITSLTDPFIALAFVRMTSLWQLQLLIAVVQYPVTILSCL